MEEGRSLCTHALLMVTAAASLALAATAAAAPSDRYAVRNHGLQQHGDRAGRARRPAARQPVGAGGERQLAVVAGQPGLEHVDDHRRRPTSNATRRAGRRAARPASWPGAGGTNFPIPGPPAGSSNFIFNTLAGEIRGWRGGIPNNDRSSGSRARTTRSTWASRSRRSAATGPRLYAADFANNRVDIVNAQWALVDAPARSSTRTCPPATAPTASRRSATASSSPTPRKAPAGIARAARARASASSTRSTLNGNFLARVASPGGVLNAPWGTALARPELRRLRRRPADRQLRRRPHQRVPRERRRHVDAAAARCKGIDGQPLFIGGLWALQFGKGAANNGAANHLYFTAGPNGETAGLFGRIIPNPTRGTDVRHRARDAVADDGHAGRVRRVHAGRRQRLQRVDHRERHHVRGWRDAERRRPEPVRDRSAGQRHVLARRSRSRSRPPARAAPAPRSARSAARARPTTLLTYPGPISNDTVTLNFRQPIAVTDALRTGAYSKTLTFTLSTTSP